MCCSLAQTAHLGDETQNLVGIAADRVAQCELLAPMRSILASSSLVSAFGSSVTSAVV